MSPAAQTSTARKPATKKTPEKVEESTVPEEVDEVTIPDPSAPVTLEDGTNVLVRPLKVRELLAAFKVITRGAALSMGALNFSMVNGNREQLVETLLAIFINSFPEADSEFCEFIRTVVDPVEPEEGWNSQDDLRRAHEKLDELLLLNPEVGDAIDILTKLITNEASDIPKLGKKVASAVTMFGKITPTQSTK